MQRYITLFLSLLILILSGCQTFNVVEPDQVTKLGNLNIKPLQQWSLYNIQDKSTRILTRDGVRLNVISVINVKDDQHIYKQRLTEHNKGFKFDESMSLHDATEMYLDALNAANVFNVDIIDESQTQISDHEATKVEYTYDLESGLTYHQIALIVKHDGQLDVLNCYAPEEHYFPLFEKEFNHIIATVKLNQ